MHDFWVFRYLNFAIYKGKSIIPDGAPYGCMWKLANRFKGTCENYVDKDNMITANICEPGYKLVAGKC